MGVVSPCDYQTPSCYTRLKCAHSALRMGYPAADVVHPYKTGTLHLKILSSPVHERVIIHALDCPAVVRLKYETEREILIAQHTQLACLKSPETAASVRSSARTCRYSQQQYPILLYCSVLSAVGD
jgi:hypothetical protein